MTDNSTVQERLDDLEKRVVKIEEQFYYDGTWLRPLPPPPVLPELVQGEVSNQYYSTGIRCWIVDAAFVCKTCGAHETKLNINVQPTESNPAIRRWTCTNGHDMRVTLRIDF